MKSGPSPSICMKRPGGDHVDESHPSVDVVNGQFTVSIGSRTAIDVAGLPELYLGITIGDEDETSPVCAVPYELHHMADHAQDVRGEDIHPASVIGNLPVIDSGWAILWATAPALRR